MFAPAISVALAWCRRSGAGFRLNASRRQAACKGELKSESRSKDKCRSKGSVVSVDAEEVLESSREIRRSDQVFANRKE